MLSNLTILFPLAVALYALLWCCRWAAIHRQAVPALQRAARAEQTAAGHTGSSRWADVPRGFTRLDWILLGALTAVYAVVAFAGLGSTAVPQNYLHFEQANTYAQIELKEPQAISAIRYWSGLNTADYLLQFSPDGENWIDQVKEDGTSGMTQQYTQLFRWNDAVLDPDNGPVRYVRITSGGAEYLGEVVLYGADGQAISPEQLIVAGGCEALFDEQDTAAAYTFKNGTYFDEIYHARTAMEHIEQVWPYEITHPPMGKMIMSLGIRLFGMTPFGWRFMGTLAGVLMLPLLYVLLKRMFGYTAVAAGGSTVFAFDFMHFVQTRIATIDSYAVFFIVMMYLFMYMWLTEPPEREGRRTAYLALTGIAFGFGAASKWVCIYAGGGLGAVWLVYWVMRFVRERKAALNGFLENVGWCLLFFIVVPCLIYYASYWSYGPSQGADGPWRLFKKEYLKTVIDNQTYMWNYHSDLVSTHPYSSKWYQWLFDVRPILYYLSSNADGTTVSFGAFNNPLVSWAGLTAMLGMVWVAVRERDERAVFILIGYLANLLPWVLVSRLTFAYHYFPSTVFLVLAIGYLFADLRRHDQCWPVSVGSFAGVTVLLFCIFYPVLAGVPRTAGYSRVFLKWFSDTWPF